MSATIYLPESRFAPLDVPDFNRKRGLEYLFQFYSIPRVFVTEREQGVTHSFGTSRGSDDSYSEHTADVCERWN